MTPEEQRIAIAEASRLYQRWKQEIAGEIHVRIVKTPSPDVADYWRSYGCSIATPSDPITEAIPSDMLDFCNDLNAVREAVMTLSNDWSEDKDGFRWNQQCEYGIQLEQIVLRNKLEATNFDVYNATAAQCCEAFLKTVNKWIE